MDKIIYERNGDDVKEANKIEFEFTSDLTIDEFKRICVRLAGALGYHNSNIIDTFGEDALESSQKDSKQIKLLLD
tara:strand:- start:659 stop:883 length:225 start_codon:yes stop_codon:yes gene_type:complete